MSSSGDIGKKPELEENSSNGTNNASDNHRENNSFEISSIMGKELELEENSNKDAYRTTDNHSENNYQTSFDQSDVKFEDNFDDDLDLLKDLEAMKDNDIDIEHILAKYDMTNIDQITIDECTNIMNGSDNCHC